MLRKDQESRMHLINKDRFNRCGFETDLEKKGGMTVVTRESSHNRIEGVKAPKQPAVRSSSGGVRLIERLGCGYEEILFRAAIRDGVPFEAELSIGNPNKQNRRRRFSFLASPLDQRLGPWCGRLSLNDLPIVFTINNNDGGVNEGNTTMSLQLVVRDGKGMVGKVFLLRVELAKMPPQSETILRQRHYYLNSLDPGWEYLQHGLQVRLRREDDSSRIRLVGSIRVIFSFNQAATISRTAAKDSILAPPSSAATDVQGIMCERLRIVTDEPTYHCFAKSHPRSSDDLPRASPYAQIS